MAATDFPISPYGVRVPRIIYGTAWKKDRTQALVAKALQLGFRGIDTAGQPKHYHEPGVGAGIAESLDESFTRADLYLQTKFTSLSGQDPSRVPYDANASLGEQVVQSFESSLRNLQTDYVDCLVLHSPMRNTDDLAEVWHAMERLFDAGGAKQLGISNCYDPNYLDQLYRSFRVKPAVVQNRFYADTNYDSEIRTLCKQHEIIYQSIWTLTANPHILSHKTTKALASKYARTCAQIFFRYLTQIDVVPLTGTTSETHMREDLEIFEFELTENECHAMDALLRSV